MNVKLGVVAKGRVVVRNCSDDVYSSLQAKILMDLTLNMFFHIKKQIFGNVFRIISAGNPTNFRSLAELIPC